MMTHQQASNVVRTFVVVLELQTTNWIRLLRRILNEWLVAAAEYNMNWWMRMKKKTIVIISKVVKISHLRILFLWRIYTFSGKVAWSKRYFMGGILLRKGSFQKFPFSCSKREISKFWWELRILLLNSLEGGAAQLRATRQSMMTLILWRSLSSAWYGITSLKVQCQKNNYQF